MLISIHLVFKIKFFSLLATVFENLFLILIYLAPILWHYFIFITLSFISFSKLLSLLNLLIPNKSFCFLIQIFYYFLAVEYFQIRYFNNRVLNSQNFEQKFVHII